MKKLLVALFLLVSSDALAETNCFVAKEGDKVLQSEGDCKTRHAPCSTFKIPLALIGFDSGILIDETHPEWPFKEGYIDIKIVDKTDKATQLSEQDLKKVTEVLKTFKLK